MIYYPDMRDHLRPCPFCGGKVKRTSVWNREKDQITQKVECWECNVTLSRTGPMRDEHALRLWVIRHWNLRLDKTQGPAWRDTLNEFEQECQACWKKIEDDFIRFTCEIRDYDRRVEKEFQYGGFCFHVREEEVQEEIDRLGPKITEADISEIAGKLFRRAIGRVENNVAEMNRMRIKTATANLEHRLNKAEKDKQ